MIPPSCSTILSSLDYRWREGVARRLVQEAKPGRSLYLHDVVFLLLLKQLPRAGRGQR